MKTTGLIGYPTDHSISPLLFNYFAKTQNLEYSHVKLNVKPDSNNLRKAIDGIRALSFAGVNITLPHKMEVMKFVDVKGEEVVKIGAVNTIVNKKGILYGYNTDYIGAIKAIENRLNRRINKKDNVLIIGSGGASRALIYGFMLKKCKITVLYRLPKSKNTKKLLNDYGKSIAAYPFDRTTYNYISDSNIICNATSVGMWPNSNKELIKKSDFRKASKISNFSNKLFFDAIFNPIETKFLIYSKEFGAKTQGGLDMMIFQGVKAFSMWTGLKIDENSIVTIRKKLIKQLNEK